MKRMKIISLVMALCMAVTMLAGCSGGEGGGRGDAYTGKVKDLGNGTDYYNGLEYPMASAEPLDLTIHMHFGNGNYIFDDDKFDVYKVAAEKTNITLHGTASKANTNSDQEFTKMLLEEKLPDIIHGTRDQINDAGVNEGAMVALDEYVLNSDYMPSLSKIYLEHPNYYESTRAADGHIYYLPKLRQAGPTQAWFTRSDWMEKLGLEDPKTFEDFENLLYAFRNDDPNGNGKQDEIPYFGNVKQLLYFFGLNGDREWDIDKDDNYYHAFSTDTYRKAVEHIAKWYADGLIDKEYYSRKNAVKELWSTNVGGITFNWFSSTMSYNEQITNVPGFHVSVMMPPENINGKAYCHSPGEIVCPTGWGISTDNEHLTETLRYLDWWYSDYGSTVNAMGVEGRDWNYDEKGVPHYTEYATNYVGGAPTYVRDIGCLDVGYYMKISYLLDGMTEEARQGNLDYIDADFTIDPLPVLTFNAEETKVITNKKSTITSYVSEKQTKWITGVEALDDASWADYLKNLEDLGIQDVVGAYNSAYGRFKKNLEAATSGSVLSAEEAVGGEAAAE